MSNPATFEEKSPTTSTARKGKGYESWYDRVGESWLGRAPSVLNEETPVRLEYFRQVLSKGVKGLKMLDLGVGGMGTIAESLLRQGAQVTLVDKHRRTLELAEAHARQTGLSITTYQAECDALPFPDESFEVVYCFDMLEHAGPALDSWLGEIQRVLKPGGIFIYNSPNRTVVAKAMLIYIFE